MAAFQFLHISDLHIAKIPDRDSPVDALKDGFKRWVDWYSGHDPAKLSAVARFAWKRRGQISRVIVTGDLSTSGRKDDLERARSFVETPAQGDSWYVDGLSGEVFPTLLNETLAGQRPAVLLMPGNHDRYRFPAYRPGGSAFDSIFKNHWTVGQGVATLDVLEDAGDPDHRLAFVAADLSLTAANRGKGPAGFIGQGRAEPGILDKLKVATADLRERFPGCAVVWLVHFPPEFKRVPSELQLVDGTLLSRAARDAGIEAIFAGHTHQPREYGPTGGPTVFCAGTASQAAVRQPEKSTLHLVTVDVRSASVTIRRQDFEWDMQNQDFVGV